MPCATAMVTNSYNLGCLEVTKVVDWVSVTPNPGQTFTVTVEGPSYPKPGISHVFGHLGGIWTLNDLIPGTYWVNESDPGSNWVVTPGLSQFVNVVPSMICTQINITNTLHCCLEVTKIVDWGSVTPDPGQTFTVTVTGPSYPSPGIIHEFGHNGETWNLDPLIPGNYTVIETNPGTKWVVTPGLTQLATVNPGLPCANVEIINTLCIYNPSINIEKYISVDNQETWHDADNPTGPVTKAGSDVYFKFVVTNTGDVDLNSISLTDSDFELSCPTIDPLPANGGSFECIHGPIIAITGQHNNSVTVTGEYNPTISDIDYANYLGINPCIEIEKKVWDEISQEWKDSLKISLGENLTFKIKVSNTGSLTLNDITVIDEFSSHLVYKYSEPNSRTIPENGYFDELTNTITWSISFIDPGEVIEIIFYAETVNRCSGWNKVNATAYYEPFDFLAYDEDLVPIKVCDNNNPEIDITKKVWNKYSLEWINFVSCSKGNNLTFKLTIRNNALNNLTDIEIIDYLPIELSYILGSASTTPSYESQNQIIWNINQMYPDEEIIITYEVETVGTDLCSNNVIVTGFINTFEFTDSDNVVIDIKDPPIVQLIYPSGGEEISGIINIKWFAIDSHCNPEICLYYSDDGGVSWNEIARNLRNNIGNNAYKDRGEYSWNTNSLSNGNYLIRINAVDSMGNRAIDESKPFCIGSRATGILVSYVSIESTGYIKDGDSIIIEAGVSFGNHISKDYVKADLTNLGKGVNVAADSFDGFTAIWNIKDVFCTPYNGLINIMVSATDGATSDSNNVTIIADNTLPELEVIKPENGLYVGDEKLFKSNKPIIIGPISIKVNAIDSSGIEKIIIYIDDKLIEIISQTMDLNCYLNQRIIGKHELKIIAYDYAGNTNEYSQKIIFLNLNGEK
jgi:uncharacterized repeat protein (TIGR01451 family)